MRLSLSLHSITASVTHLYEKLLTDVWCCAPEVRSSPSCEAELDRPDRKHQRSRQRCRRVCGATGSSARSSQAAAPSGSGRRVLGLRILKSVQVLVNECSCQPEQRDEGMAPSSERPRCGSAVEEVRGRQRPLG